MYTTLEKLISSTLGTTRSDLRPLTVALSVIVQLHLVQRIPREDIKVTQMVYPKVAQYLNKSEFATARSIERLANLCFDAIKQQSQIEKIFRSHFTNAPSSANILFYLAYFLYHHGKSFLPLLPIQIFLIPSIRRFNLEFLFPVGN